MSILFGIKIFDVSSKGVITEAINKMIPASSIHDNEKLETYLSPCNTIMLCGTKMMSTSKDNISFLHGHLFDDVENTEKKLETLTKHLSQRDLANIALNQTNGAFSIIHYNKNNQLILAVDQLGIKSLYFALFKQGIVFSSSLSVLFASSLVKPKFSPEIFLLNATVRMDAVSDLTWFDGVKQLEPGEFVTIDSENRINVKRYWLPPLDEKIIHEAEFFESFMKATKIRSKSDNLGVLLSGGVDSAAVAAALIKQGKEFVPGMFLYEGVSENEHLDLVYAKRFLKYYKREGHTFQIKVDNIYSVLKKIVLILQRPLVHGCEIGMYFSYEKFKELDCKIIYTGTGADIMWGEQNSQYFPILASNFKVDMHSEYYLKNFLYQNDTKEWYYFLLNTFYNLFQISQETVNNLIWEKIFSPYRLYLTNDLFKKPRLLELYRNVAYINHMNNAISGYFGMDEVPVFQDLNLVNMSFQFPEVIKNKSNEYSLKPFLKKSFKPLLPEFILKRKKLGFPPPNLTIWKKELIDILRSGLPFGVNINNDKLKQMSFTELLFLTTSKIWLEEFNLC